MDKRIFEGVCLTIDLNKIKYADLCQLCLSPPCDYDDIKSILVMGKMGKDFELFLSILNIYYPHLIPRVLIDKEPTWEFVREIREEDIEVEWWLRV